MFLISEYPLWLIIPCLILGFGYAFFLYRKDSRYSEISKWKIYVLSAIRFLTTSFLLFLLIGPIVKAIKKEIDKPIVLIAHDNSASVLINSDSSYFKDQYKIEFSEFVNSLSKTYECVEFSFDSDVQELHELNFSGKGTNVNKAVEDISLKYQNRNIGAMILAWDGIYTEGLNPVFQADEYTFPIYSIGLGDTTENKDFILSDVIHNKIAFKGNSFPIRCQINSHKIGGDSAKIEIFENGSLKKSQEIIFNSENQTHSIDFELDAENVGLQRFSAQIKSSVSEINLENNKVDFIVEVIDRKQKILILSQSPHPDIGAINRSLSQSNNYEIIVENVRNFKQEISDFNLVILHQLPSFEYKLTDLFTEIKQKKIPVLYIVGNATDLAAFNNQKTGLVISRKKNDNENYQALFSENFDVFELSEENIDFFNDVPPLISPFGEYRVRGEIDILFNQKYKNIDTGQPLMFFTKADNHKKAVISGEGIWRWKMQDFKINRNHNNFNSLINKTVQFLALKINKERFIVNSKQIFTETDDIEFSAELYNESFEPVTDHDVSLDISDAQGNNYDFSFSPTGISYTLNAGSLPVGTYQYFAVASLNGEELTKSGTFNVMAVNVEALQTVANHSILRQISDLSGGKFYYPAEFKELETEIKQNSNLFSLERVSEDLIEFIDFVWIAWLLIGLLSVEWFIRKYLGGY